MRSLSTGRGPILAAAVLGVVGLSTSAFAAVGTWSGAATPDTSWATPGNWDVVPGSVGTTTNADTATFPTTANLLVTVDAGRNVQNVTISSTSTYNIGNGGANTLLLTSGGLLQATATAVSETVSAPLQVQGDGGTYTINTQTPGGNRVFTVSGGLTGVSTGANVTAVTLGGVSTATNVISGVIGDGSAGGKLAIVKADAGTWSLTNTNTYTGGTTVTGGTLVSGSATPNVQIGSGTATINGGTLRLSSTASTFTNALVVGPAGGFLSTKSSTLSMSSTTGTGALSLVADAGSTVTPSNNSFGGFAGTLNVGGGFTLRLGTNLTNFDAANAFAALSLNLNTATSSVTRGFGTNGVQTVNIGTLAGVAGATLGNNTAATGTFTYSVGARNEDSTFAGVLVVGGTKNALTKVGTGALTLTGVNTYTGATTVTGGTLALSGSGSIAQSASIVVGAAGTFDTTAGSFTLGSAQALALAGTFKGTLAGNATTAITPGGAAAIGAANVNSTTLVAGSTLTADLSSATSDALNVVGTIDLGGATLTLNNLASPTAIGQLYTLVANDGTDPTVGTFSGLADGATVVAGVDSYTLRYNAFGGNDVTLTALTAAAAAVPEPTTLAAIGLTGSLLLKRRRRA